MLFKPPGGCGTVPTSTERIQRIQNTMIFRRPELEKDNPIAPQPYLGPRRRLAMTRASATAESTELHDMKEMLQTLTKAASRYVNNLPRTRRTGKSLKALHDAITQAERVLVVKGSSSGSHHQS